MRKSGILLPVTSLPSEYGIGCFSKSAYDFVDWLRASGQAYWQILPLCPTGFGNSPYQSFCTFAGNPYMISIKELIRAGLLKKDECDNVDFGSNNNYIDYGKQYSKRIPLLRKAYERSTIKNTPEYREFEKENDFFLEDYSLFMALKDKFGQIPLCNWPSDIKKRKSSAMETYRDILHEETGFYKFLQYMFYTQWYKLKNYANQNNISIIGDLPIYVSADSADIWSNPELFMLNDNLEPTHSAGCPPDGFAPKGQLWGNPLYNWDKHSTTEYEWWIRRLKHSLTMYDMVRLDHFRGFDEYYSIAYPSCDAVCGKWKKGPGIELFESARKVLGNIRCIAEDLGFVTQSVKSLLNSCGFPGMRVLEFAFDPHDTNGKNEHLPHNYIPDCVAYTGTHDNMTVVSWYNSISEQERSMINRYLAISNTCKCNIHIPLISLVMRSAADLCIIPMQDWLGLTDEARINTPSSMENNWCWRTEKKHFRGELCREIYNTTQIYGRL